MRTNQLALVALLAGAAALAACDKARPVVAAGTPSTSCTGCHGGLDNATGAPPRDTSGRTATSVITVGAHTAHINAGLGCEACHIKPARIEDPGHINGEAKITFGVVAKLNGASPVFNPLTGTCSNVYCHGSTLPSGAQGQATTPAWTAPSLAGSPCGACHGTPGSTTGAPTGHGANLTALDCGTCHGSSVAADGTIIPAADGGKHINGTVDVSAGACNACHGDKNGTRGEATGSDANFAPPVDTAGASTGAKVGAHLRHVSTTAAGSRLSKPFGCSECHVKPTAVPHNAVSVVQFTAGALALTGGLTPGYAGGTCSNVYCHGATLKGGTSKSPSWTSAVACGDCHFHGSAAAPPPAGHPQVDKAGNPIVADTQCNACHPGTVRSDGTIDIALGNHVNGTLEVTNPHAAGWVASTVHGAAAKLDLQSCTACHGATFAADMGGGKSCNTCHANPVTFIPGYTGATHPAWQTECTFCHGDKNRADVAAQGSAGTPAINAGKIGPPLGSQDELLITDNAVGAHLRHFSDDATTGNRLSAPIQCQHCHGASILTDAAHQGVGHVDGSVVIGWQGSGTVLGAAAGGAVPSPAAGPYPSARDAAGVLRSTATSCANYCHGATLAGGTATTATWTAGGAVVCTTCHGYPPPYANPSWHVQNTSCVTCHGFDQAAVNKTLHVNGTLNLAATVTCHSCHGSATNNAPPAAASSGATATTDATVGAHQAHVTQTNLRAVAIACTDCHGATLPTAMNHANGAVTIGWSALATTGGLVPTPTAGTVSPGGTATCANYCHGQKWVGNANYAGSVSAPSWTKVDGTQAACGTCHKAPPTSSAHGSVTATTNCGACHTGYNCTSGNLAACTVNKTVHINGQTDGPNSCGGCHGSATARTIAVGTLGPYDTANNLQGAPPNDVAGSATSNQVGPHQGHVNPASPGPQYYKPVLCSECHTAAVNTFATSGHAALSPKVQFGAGTAAALGGTVTAYLNNPVATPDTCTTYCHGGSLTAAQKGVITTWQWTTGVTVACNSCHATPPRDTVHTSVATVPAATTGLSCVPCHNTTLTAAGAILFTGTGTAATTLHINGTRQNTAVCTSCHGTLGANAAPPTATNGTSAGVKVGAHQKHVTGTTLKAAALACTECHTLPTVMTHASGVVDMTYGTLAKTGSIVPTPANLGTGTTPTLATWEGAPNCTNYCHGQKWAGNANYAGTVAVPTWTGTSASAACDACHKAPPVSTAHASVVSTTSCGNCHTGYTCTSGNLAACTVNKTVHMNGVTDSNVNSCGACHGSATARTIAVGTLGPYDTANNLQGAPPNDASGGAVTSNQVGPHQGHVNPASPGPQYYKPVLCSECHTAAVNSFLTSGHAALSPKVQFGAGTAAALGGTVTAYLNNPVATPDTCTTYCHGGSLTSAQKGVITTWQWTQGVTVACNSCHATPPRDAVHTSVATVAAATTGLSCVPCHNTTLTAAGAILFTGTGTAATTLHINGTRQNTAVCTSCHGTLGVNAAPPTATNGTTTGVKVGAHQKHVTGTTLKAAALACTECHTLPTVMTHASGVVDMTYGTLAKTGSIVPTPANLGTGTTPTLATWEGAPNCTNYCHGQKWAGNANYAGTVAVPTWTGTSASAACDACHKAPPVSTAHASVVSTTSCGNCHTGYTCTSGNLAACTVNKTVHMNGVTDSNVNSCGACHGSATARTIAVGTLGPYDTANNLQGAPPNDASGGAVTSNQVGPHQGHVNPASPGPQYYKPVLCSECHTAAVNSFLTSGHAALSPKVQFGAGTAAALGGTVTAYLNNPVATPDTCTTYCHGGSLTSAQKGVITTWQWTTGVTVACNSCHATPPRDAVHTSVATVAAATTGLSCVPCHNTTLTAAGAILFTGTGTAATTLHINGTRQNTAVCTSCHGTLGVNAAPPTATNGTTTGVKVGAHQKHVTATNLRATALACTDCHTLPTLTNHASGVVDMTYGALAKTGSIVPTPATINATWEATPTCTNYCHGAKNIGNANYAGSTTSPSWIGTSTSTACDACHKAPPSSAAHASVTTTTQCGTCHNGYTCTSGNLAACTVNKAWHIDGTVQSAGTCIDCHTGTQGTRRAIVPEFASAWSHKRSAVPTGTVTKFDCVVCHMEGNLTTGDPDPTWHPMTPGGNIDLRDPDTGLHIKGVTFTAANGTSPGSYATTATDMVFTEFSRNLAMVFESDPAAPTLQAIMINQCLKCHDSNGATAAFVPGGSATKPFNTTIAGTTYTGAGVTAGGVTGGVTDVNASFATTNASYHPIRGKQNNSYVSALRMNAPWTTITKTAGVINTTAAWGYLISCWDCHAPLGTGAVTLTASVTAHGGATILRQQVGTANATNLCTVCHLVVPVTGSSTSNHGAGSAFASGGNSGPGGIARTSCWRCHGGDDAGKAPRPYAGQNAHGFDSFSPVMGTDQMWPIGTTETYRPYAFMRSVGATGMWKTTAWKPLSGPGVTTGAATCGGSAALGSGCGSQNHGTYTPGGNF